MTVVVDTSAWSFYLRRKPDPENPTWKAMDALLADEEDLVLLGVVLEELLSGFREPDRYERIKIMVADVPLLEPDRADYEDAARLKNLCAARGTQVSTIDGLIAAVAIRLGAPLFTLDQDFARIAEVAPLQLYAA